MGRIKRQKKKKKGTKHYRRFNNCRKQPGFLGLQQGEKGSWGLLKGQGNWDSDLS